MIWPWSTKDKDCYDKMDHGLVRSPKYYFIGSEHNKVTQLK